MSKKHRQRQGKSKRHARKDDGQQFGAYSINANRDRQFAEHLQIAVPLWILSLYERGGITRNDLNQAYVAMECVGCTTDRFLRGATKEGEIAEIFNRVAKSIAVLSYMPGGVDTFDHWYDAETFLTGFIGKDAAHEHVTSALERCYGEKPIGQKALDEMVREALEEKHASARGKRSSNP